MLEIQSLSVCVPGGCPNNCKFCVSQMHDSPYSNHIERNLRFRDLYERDFVRRLQFARDNGCNTIILTGDGEPLLNRDFLKDFAHWNNSMSSPFRWVEIQTSGVTLDDEALRFLRNTVGISTISLSVSDLFSDDNNQAMNGTPDKLKVNLIHLCSEIKRYDFNLRLSLNMTDAYEERFKNHTHQGICSNILDRARRFGADQVTFRKLYVSGNPELEQNRWIKFHAADEDLIISINQYVRENGRALEQLPFGAVRYALDGLSVVADMDCMSTDVKPVMKYLILRPNCKLYTKWDDTGSLLF